MDGSESKFSRLFIVFSSSSQSLYGARRALPCHVLKRVTSHFLSERKRNSTHTTPSPLATLKIFYLIRSDDLLGADIFV